MFPSYLVTVTGLLAASLLVLITGNVNLWVLSSKGLGRDFGPNRMMFCGSGYIWFEKS